MNWKQTLQRQKQEGHKIAMVTAYDAAFARMAEAVAMDMILVGDSAANVVLGYKSTRDIGMNEMLMFVAAVRRGAPSTHIVADMPWQSDVDPGTALANARRFIEVGADTVKIEGPQFDVIDALCGNGIQVVGHLGLLPQTATSFRQQGKDPEQAAQIIAQAKKLDDIGICALVMEHVPDSLGSLVAQGIAAPVIGIGAGKNVDGQVLVLHDLLGMHPFSIPPFATRFVDLYGAATQAMKLYIDSVRS